MENQMFFREHRNTLHDSMNTQVRLPANKQALIQHINARLKEDGYDALPPIQTSHLTVTHYCKETRKEAGDFCGKETFIVQAKGWGVIGFCTEKV